MPLGDNTKATYFYLAEVAVKNKIPTFIIKIALNKNKRIVANIVILY